MKKLITLSSELEITYYIIVFLLNHIYCIIWSILKLGLYPFSDYDLDYITWTILIILHMVIFYIYRNFFYVIIIQFMLIIITYII